MNVIFTQEDGTERRWDRFKPDRIMSTEAEAIEKVTGLTFAQWGQSLMNGSAIAGRALVWVLRKREDPTLRFRHVDFPVGDLVVALDDNERLKVLDAIENDDTLSDADREQARAAIQASAAADDTDPAPVAVDDLIDPDGPGNVPVAPTGNATA